MPLKAEAVDIPTAGLTISIDASNLDDEGRVAIDRILVKARDALRDM